MFPNDMISDNIGKQYTDAQINGMWPSGRRELLGFADALERGKSGITAAQIRMAVQMADRYFESTNATPAKDQFTDTDPTCRIWKYVLPDATVAVITMPAGADVLCVQVQHDTVCLWAKVSVDATPTPRTFFIVGTGQPIPVAAKEYIGTFQLYGGDQVYHVFEGP